MNVRDLVPWSRGDRENRLFDDVFRGLESPALWGHRGAWPSVDVEETDKEYRVAAKLPGLEEKDVEVLFHDGVLSIRGEKRIEKETGHKTFSERYYGRFERQIALDRDIDESAIHATFRNGVLAVTVPKWAQSIERTKRIPINSASKSH